MNNAIATLDNAAQASLINAPIWEVEGNAEQAKLCRDTADECARAVTILETIQEGCRAESE